MKFEKIFITKKKNSATQSEKYNRVKNYRFFEVLVRTFSCSFELMVQLFLILKSGLK